MLIFKVMVMGRVHYLLLLVLSLVFLFSLSAQAESARSWVKVSQDVASFPHFLTVDILGAGRAQIRLERRFPIHGLEQTGIVNLQGEASFQSSGRTVPVVATLFGAQENRRLKVLLWSDGAVRKLRKRSRFFQLELPFNSSSERQAARFRRVRRDRNLATDEPEVSCGVTGESRAQRAFSPGVTVLKELGITIDFDSEFESLAGGDPLPLIAQFVTVTDTILKRDLGVTLKVAVNPQAVAYESAIFGYSSAQPILSEVAEKHPASTRDEEYGDLVYVFSGKQRDAGNNVPIGAVPAIGQTCITPDLALGFVRYTEDLGLDLITPAHEIGHNLGAIHDDNYGQPHVMNATWFWWDLVSEEPSFSSYSKLEIESFLSSSGSCLANVSDDGRADYGVKLRKPKKGRKLTIKVKDRLTKQGVGDVLVEIYCRASSAQEFDLCASKRTNQKGVLKVKGQKGRKYQARVSVDGVPFESKVVTLKKNRKS